MIGKDDIEFFQLFSHQGTKTQRGDKYKLNNGVFSLMSLRLINFNVPRTKKDIIKNNFIVLVSWCLCGKIPE